MKTHDLINALQPFTNALEALNIPYYIGGSVASSLYGFARATMDIDIVAKIANKHISLLKTHLSEQYFFDEEMVADAIRCNATFNLIHLETMIKIDVFIFKNEPYQRESFQRKQKDSLDEDVPYAFSFASPEDIVLNKLQWYKMGGEISERQWLDVIGVIKVQGDALDKPYLRKWAKELAVLDLLQKAFQEAGF